MPEFSTVLVVEDDKAIRQMLREFLETENFIVIDASKGARSVEIIQHHKVDIVLLDLGLPDAKGMEYISTIRAHTNVPLIVVSGEEDISKKVETLECGADDFISKPINFDMLIAKMKAQIRRHKSLHSEITDKVEVEQNATKILFDKWVLHKGKYQVFDENENSAHLTLKEFMILDVLINNRGRTLSRAELCKVIQEQNYVPNDRVIDVKITRIRKKIGDNPSDPKVIQTVRGAGYLFSAEIKHIYD